MIIINFIRDKDVGIFARVKRPPRVTKAITPPAVELDGGCAEERVLESKEQNGDGVRRRR